MWSANFEDGTSVSSKNTYWTELDKSKRMTGVFLIHPLMPNLRLCLTGLDSYFYMMEAVATFTPASNSNPFIKGTPPTLQSNNVVAEVIGGVKSDIVIEQRLEYSGVVITRAYPIAQCKVSRDVMYKGK